LTSATTATVMTEKIQQISEDYVNGLIEIITKAINERVDAIDITPVDEEECRRIAKDEVTDAIDSLEVHVDCEAHLS